MSKTNMKILNLDTLPTTTPRRQITVGGITYDVLEMSVEGFIETNLAADRLEGVTDLEVQLNETVASIKRDVPTIPEDVLRKLPLEKLGVLASFIRGMFDPDAPAAVEGDQKK